MSAILSLAPAENGHTHVTCRNILTGNVSTVTLNAPQELLAAWATGGAGLVQDTFPNLSADEREFLLTGMEPGEWDDMFEDDGSDISADAWAE